MKASNKLNSTQRQKRTLKVPAPARKGNYKVPVEGWINAAKVVLIEEGISACKIDRLALRLKVTRGGFYHFFKSQHELLEELLKDWQLNNRFTPDRIDTSSIKATTETFRELIDKLIHSRDFDPQYDLAIREWARISVPVADVVHAADEQRIDTIRAIFEGFGYKAKDALIRARVFYWHQIGYYSIGVRETLAEREANAETYLEVLGGEKYLQAMKKAKA